MTDFIYIYVEERYFYINIIVVNLNCTNHVTANKIIYFGSNDKRPRIKAPNNGKYKLMFLCHIFVCFLCLCFTVQTCTIFFVFVITIKTCFNSLF